MERQEDFQTSNPVENKDQVTIKLELKKKH